ncbi:hypothetical protein ACHAXR_008393 [Thalassiosira sp. AJA248-18]
MSSPNLTRETTTFPNRTASEQSITLPRAASTKNENGSSTVNNPLSSSSPSAPRSSSTSSSKQAYTTEIVKALFGGGAVGDVVQDFSCSFQRQAGRLYVSTDGLFFYSNLFGFEKRIRINYDQAMEITKLRSTSLSVKTVEGMEWVFRSFDDREYVLDIILSFHSNKGAAAEQCDTSTSGLGDVDPVSCDQSFVDDDDSSRHSPTLPDLANEHQLDDSPDNDAQSQLQNDKTEKIDIRGDSGGTDYNNIKRWEEMRQHAKGWESAVVNLKIGCTSVKDFFDLFLKDGAANSLNQFQSNVIGDKNVSIGAWKLEDTTNADKSLVRLIQLEHKSGVSMAQVSRRQTYQCLGNCACLRNTTSIKGIKGAPCDAFFVEDIWFIEKDEEINLNVKFRINFTKSTMLRSIIESRSKAETKEYYRKYSAYVRQKMHQNVPIQEEMPPSTAAAKTNADWLGIIASLARPYMPDLPTFYQNAPISALIIFFALVVYRLKQRVMVLEVMVEEFERRLIELEKSGFSFNE